MIYKIQIVEMYGNKIVSFLQDNGDNSFTVIAANPESSQYQSLKAQINADEAQLEDADGNLMTPEEAKAFVATLP